MYIHMCVQYIDYIILLKSFRKHYISSPRLNQSATCGALPNFTPGMLFALDVGAIPVSPPSLCESVSSNNRLMTIFIIYYYYYH